MECDEPGEDHERRVRGEHLKIQKLGKLRQSRCEHLPKLKAMKSVAHVFRAAGLKCAKDRQWLLS